MVMCIECLERRIESDFSNKLNFIHPLSDSPLPFASQAVVSFQSSSSNSHQRYLLNYITCHPHDCLSKYLEEYCCDDVDDDDGKRKGQLEGFFDIGKGHDDTCNTISSHFSCSRAITSLAPIARVGNASFEELALDFSTGNIEDHVLRSLTLLIEGKSTGREGVNFLSLVGLPSFEEKGFPGCIRHPNIAPVLGMLRSSSQVNVVVPKTTYTLENMLYYSVGVFKSEWHVRLLIYQMLSALAYMHGLGIAHGNLRPSSVMLSDTLWCWLEIGEKQLNNSKVDSTGESYNLSTRNLCYEGCSTWAIYADLSISSSLNWQSSFYSWWKGELSNFEYLLVLNRLAGRRWGDHTFYTVMPWVTDFSVKPDENSETGWRDLRKSKWRLAKGDEQLDFTYSTSEVPHHISDECLSELAVCSYKARRLPLSVLRSAVRSVYEPNEYPGNMQRLYQWTPDECIPEFYCDPRVFCSIHPGMPDLAVPGWASNPEEFIKLHRSALESEHVSSQIHHWIDITFGYKMSGEAAIAAKNVMLPASTSTMPRPTGRRQLFTEPHPQRQSLKRGTCLSNKGSTGLGNTDIETNLLSELEVATSFCENSWHLSPCYTSILEDNSSDKELSHTSSEIASREDSDIVRNCGVSTIDTNYLLEKIQVDDDNSLGYHEMLLWGQNLFSELSARKTADDIFGIGCILAELYLKKPLFGLNSLVSCLETCAPPSTVNELPCHVQSIVQACIQTDWKMRPSAACLLESPYFSESIKSSYLFLASFHLLAKDESRLRYAATFAKQGALRRMGAFGAEMCAPYCLPIVVASTSDTEAESAYVLLTEFLKILKLEAVKKLIMPSVQRILQATGHSHLKVSLLQGSFVQEIWNKIGKQSYLDAMHPLIISNLCVTPQTSSTTAASVLLIGSSEELGLPVTFHQTILPLILCFGKGLCSDGVDVVIRIGGLLGESFVVKQILPLLRTFVHSCIHNAVAIRSEPVQSWSSLALIDCLTTIDGLVPFLTTENIVKELMEDKSPYAKILMHKDISHRVLQNTAKSLIKVCQMIGPDLTALHVLPRLKELLDELAFSQNKNSYSGFPVGNVGGPRTEVGEEHSIESRMDLVLLLYPQFASLLGIEKLRQCCTSWLILEQFLLRYHKWKWEYPGDSSQSGLDGLSVKKITYTRVPAADTAPSKHVRTGFGWSRTQSKGKRGVKNLKPTRLHQNSIQSDGISSNLAMHEPWYWFPGPADSWDGFDHSMRAGNSKDELQWKIRASIVHSVRAHHGALRSIAVCADESTVFTAGVGPGFKGNIQKWELSGVDCALSYNGHEEVVNDVRVLACSGRVASCDGTVHIWNGHTGNLISVFSERSVASTKSSDKEEDNMLHYNPLSSGMLGTAFHGNSYTTMDHLEFVNKLVVGTGNGSLRFIDVNQGQQLHLWKSEYTDSGFSPLISSICSSGSSKLDAEEANAGPPSWIAAACSTGRCSLYDMRSGNIIATWQAHDGYVTKLAAASDHLLVSSSLDKTLRIWDLRRNWTSERTIFKGYNDGISSFSVWGQNVISVCKNKIGYCSLSSSTNEDGQYWSTPQHLYMVDGESKNMSMLSAICILPFSRLFLVGTDDGHLQICC